MKKGISLVALVITIIVLIILTGTVIISIVHNNTINKAEEAKNAHNLATMQDAAMLAYNELLLENGGDNSKITAEAIKQRMKEKGVDPTEYNISFDTASGRVNVTKNENSGEPEIGGNGEITAEVIPAGSIPIGSAEDFSKIGNGNSETLSDGNTYSMVDTGTYYLANSITVSSFNPIDYFNGKIYGNNKTVTISSINAEPLQLGLEVNTIGISLINILGESGYVSDLTVNGSMSYSSSNSYDLMAAGIIAGINLGIIENCENNAGVNINVTQSESEMESIGGIVGINIGTVKKSCNLGTVRSNLAFIGGIVGMNADLFALSEIPVSFKTKTGLSLIEETYNSGSVSGLNGEKAGIAGCNIGGASIKNCYNIGNITSDDSLASGIVGHTMSASVDNVYNLGTITAGTDKYQITKNEGDAAITNCYYVAISDNDNDSIMKTSTEFTDGTVLGLLNGRYNVWKNANSRISLNWE